MDWESSYIRYRKGYIFRGLDIHLVSFELFTEVRKYKTRKSDDVGIPLFILFLLIVISPLHFVDVLNVWKFPQYEVNRVAFNFFSI